MAEVFQLCSAVHCVSIGAGALAEPSAERGDVLDMLNSLPGMPFCGLQFVGIMPCRATLPHTHVHTYTCAHAHTHTYTCTHTLSHTHTRTHTLSHTHTHTHIHTHTHTHTHTHAHTHTRAHTHTPHTHTHTHTHARKHTNTHRCSPYIILRLGEDRP